MSHLRANLYLIGLTLLLCGVAYPLSILAVGQGLFPTTANGSIVTGPGGEPVGSVLIAQDFQRPEYIHPRPSAAGYNGAASSGSNLGANNPKLRQRVAEQVGKEYPDADREAVPADAVTASGSGLDPHLTLRAARRQLDRVAAARGKPVGEIDRVLTASSSTPLGGLAGEPLVNVLEANRELDQAFPLTAR